MSREVSENVTTLASYEAAADLYVAHQPPTAPAALLTFLDAIAELLPNGGRVLEIGSATGQDAALLEARGLRVRRTDATGGFVKRLRSLGVEAEILNVVTDELGGPWEGIFANAVFLHLNVCELAGVLAKTARSVTPGGILGFTVKEGDGAGWSTAKLNLPRQSPTGVPLRCERWSTHRHGTWSRSTVSPAPRTTGCTACAACRPL
jgi:SAM-dependent methyltransferase